VEPNAFCRLGTLLTPDRFSLSGYPCGTLHACDALVIPDRVMDRFPDATALGELDARAYMGVAVRDRDGQMVGMLCMFDSRPRPDFEEFRDIFRMTAQRIGAELERLDAIDQLCRSETKYRALVTAMPDMMFLQDADGVYLDYYAPDESLLFCPPDRFLGVRMTDIPGLLDPNDGVHAAFRRALTTDEPQVVEYQRERFGEIRYWETRMVRTSDDRVLTIVQNITDRKRTEAALAASETRFRRMFESHDAVMLLLDPETMCLIDANNAAARFYGYDRDTLRSMRITEINIADPSVVRERLGEALSGARNVFRYQHRLASGEIRTIEDHTSPIEFEGRPILFGVITDISQRVLAIEALEASEQRYRNLFDQAGDALFIENADGAIVEVNERACTLFGFTREEMLSHWLVDVLAANVDDPARFGDRIRTSSEPCEVHTARRDGTPIIVEFTCTAFRDDLRLAVVRDVTERREAERERAELESRIQHAQKMESLGLLAGGVAHDFNNLLVAILGNTSLALRRVEDPVARTAVERAELAASRAADLTRQMLAYSGKGSFVVGPVDLTALVEEMTDLLDASISRLVTVERDLRPVPSVEADDSQMRQIVLNLMTNASEAIGEGTGVVRIRTRVRTYDEHDLAPMTCNDRCRPGAYVVIEVDDSGSGMDDATIERMFDPFYTTKFT
ncbi:MAG: PAS domain S-box protein, partial [Phycisphaerales bacterium]|nr:PAS domain S-box protein [Phycisphaerales bacterium]